MYWKDEEMSIADIFDTMDYGPAPEIAAEALAWLVDQGDRFGHFIDGAFTAPGDGFESRNPATGEVLATLTQATQADVDAAVAAARKAQPKWEKLGGHGRAQVPLCHRTAAAKTQPPVCGARNARQRQTDPRSRDIDMPLAQRHFYYHAGMAQLMESELPDAQALGVCGQIIPWNFPLLMLAWKIAPALAMGNTVVLKPAEYTSLTALLFADICRQAGLPKGVVNIVTGDGAVGEMIVACGCRQDRLHRLDRRRAPHPRGDRRHRQGADAWSWAANPPTSCSTMPIWIPPSKGWSMRSGSIRGRSAAPGRACWCRNRWPICSTPSCAPGWTSCASASRWTNALTWARWSIRCNCRAITRDGRRQTRQAQTYVADTPLPEQGCFYPPTLITGLNPADTLMQEEIFGPVLVSTTFRTPAEAVELANNTRYGLAATVWSENINLALDIAPKLAAGVVWVNGTNLMDAAAGFGGVRESGFGREGGWEGLAAYTKPKATAKPLKEIAAVHWRGCDRQTAIDRTAKLYIGGKQARPDGGYSAPVYGKTRHAVGARLASPTARTCATPSRRPMPQKDGPRPPGHLRAQILYYIAENLDARADEFASTARRDAGRQDRRERGRGVRQTLVHLCGMGRQIRRSGPWCADPRRGDWR